MGKLHHMQSITCDVALWLLGSATEACCITNLRRALPKKPVDYGCVCHAVSNKCIARWRTRKMLQRACIPLIRAQPHNIQHQVDIRSRSVGYRYMHVASALDVSRWYRTEVKTSGTGRC